MTRQILLVLFTIAVAANTTLAADAPRTVFKRDIQPLLRKYCVRCHTPKKPAGKVNIVSISTAFSPLKDRKAWRKLLAKLKDGEMPPEKPLPTMAERKRMIDWIESATRIDWNKVKHPGHVTAPRLTRDEYNHTMHDLLGVDLKPGDTFSPDGEGESGFNNDRDALFIAPLLMEKYFTAARSSLDTLIAMRGKPLDIKFEAEKMHMTERNSPPAAFGYILNRGQMTLYDSVTFPRSGRYVITVRSWALGRATGARLRINDDIKGDIHVPSREPAEYTITVFVKSGTHQMAWNVQAPPRPRASGDEESIDDVAGKKKSRKNRRKRKITTKSANSKITGSAKKNAPFFPPAKKEIPAVRRARLRLNSAAYALQRPYEWLRLLTPQGDSREIARFKGYIVDRTPSVTKAKQSLAKSLKITLTELDKRWASHNSARLSDNKKLLAAVAKIKAPKRKAKKPKKGRRNRPGNVAIDWIRIQGPVFDQKLPKLSRVFITKPGKGLSKQAAAAKIIRRFASRAFRRPVTNDEVSRYLKLFDIADARGDQFEQAVKLPLMAVLVSPHFLYRMEIGPKAEGEFRLNDYQLAARLSYFLWMSIPDDTLFDLAAKNQLHKPDVLQQQVLRMIKDPKSHRFTRAFVTQWFGLGALGKTVGPDRKKFRTFTPTLKQAMIDEAVLFVDLLFRADRSLLELLNSRETFLNEELARHYSLAGVKGPQMRRVRMSDRNRGGVLGMAGVLTATSLPLRTSPVIRGKWVLETLLGEKQPDPPANVPELAKDAGEKQGKSLREIYALHRAKASCAVCHRRMDPIGFGLQNFDAIGRWRDTQRGKRIDSTGTLPGGQKFSGPVELRRILLGRRSDIARNLSRTMLSFALGRRLEYFDEPAVRKIQAAIEKGDYKATQLILAVVNSYPFRYQHSRPTAKEP